METVKKLESTIEEILKPIPHMPTNWRKWLAVNAWWMAAISAILMILAAITTIGMIFTALSYLGALNSYSQSIFGYAISQAYVQYSWPMVISSVISIASMAISTVIYYKAITPLKLMDKKGWDLLFLGFVINMGLSLIGDLVAFGQVSFIGNVVGTLIGAAVGAYVIFETKMYYHGAKAKSAQKTE
ncbi:hypothetical protein HGB24_02425 [Candidatus Saccharibacteria bacterium]|nr:hypothetical protein [Candidatus Saccharibacteria bacterium]